VLLLACKLSLPLGRALFKSQRAYSSQVLQSSAYLATCSRKGVDGWAKSVCVLMGQSSTWWRCNCCYLQCLGLSCFGLGHLGTGFNLCLALSRTRMNVQDQAWFWSRDQTPSTNSRSEVGAISVGEKVRGGGEISLFGSAEHLSGVLSQWGWEQIPWEKGWGFCHLGITFWIWKNSCRLEDRPTNVTLSPGQSSTGRVVLNLLRQS